MRRPVSVRSRLRTCALAALQQETGIGQRRFRTFMAMRNLRRRRPAVFPRLTRLLSAMRSRLAFRRSAVGGGELAFKQSETVESSPRSMPPAEQADLIELGLELTRTLDQHRMSRSVMPALVLLERALRRATGRGVGRLASPVLWDAVNHLDMLADSWQGSRLAVLRRHLTAALGLDDGDVDVLCASKQACQVDDACLTDFMEVMHEWDRHAESANDMAVGTSSR